MNRNSPNCSTYFDARERDGEINALFFLDKTQQNTEGRPRSDLRFLDLERGEIIDVLSTILPDVHHGFSVVTCGNHAYAIGGKIRRCRSSCLTDHVFRFDFKHAKLEWEQVTSTLYRRCFPEALTAEGKIYIFEGCDVSFGEEYDISEDTWVPLCTPSFWDYSIISHPVILDSSLSRISVRFRRDRYRSLHVYYYKDKSWVCLDSQFPYWSRTVEFAVNVLYVFCEVSNEPSYWKAYDVQNKRWLHMTWLTNFSLNEPVAAPLIHLGHEKWSMIWHNYRRNCFE